MQCDFKDFDLQWLAMDMLDVEAVRAFVLAADLKSFTRAAEAMETTQSVVSLKIKRLETRLGRRLLERTPRLVRLSADGSAFLGSARALLAAHGAALTSFSPERRKLRIGMSHHVVGADLPRLLGQAHEADPGILVELRVASSWEVQTQFDAGELDAGIVLRHELHRRDGELLVEEPFAWMGSPGFERRAGEPLHLATQADPCSIRAMAIDALDAAGVAWTEVFVGGGLATIGAAVSAGLGVAALGRHVAPSATVDVGPRLGLPSLPSRDIVLHAAATDARARRCIKTLCATFRGGR